MLSFVPGHNICAAFCAVLPHAAPYEVFPGRDLMKGNFIRQSYRNRFIVAELVFDWILQGKVMPNGSPRHPKEFKEKQENAKANALEPQLLKSALSLRSSM